jgi:hypothetical protein
MTKAQDMSNDMSWAICMFFSLTYIIYTNDFLGTTSLQTTGDDASQPCVTIVQRVNDNDRMLGTTNEYDKQVRRRVLGLLYVFFSFLIYHFY